MEPTEIQARATIAAAVILSRAVEAPSIRREGVTVQAFIAQLAVEAFDKRISTGLPGRMKSRRTSWAYAREVRDQLLQLRILVPQRPWSDTG